MTDTRPWSRNDRIAKLSGLLLAPPCNMEHCEQCDAYRQELAELLRAREARMVARSAELGRLTKSKLAVMHSANSGLLSAVEYIKWKHEELVNAVLEDEGLL
jgi:hypothetical protein